MATDVSTLKLALIHPDVQYKSVDANVAHLLALNRRAARSGHQIIVNTEMGLSGYSFLSQKDAAPYTLARDSAPIARFRALAEEFGIYICLGYAEQAAQAALMYNTAQVFGPDGKIHITYRKINAEPRWACPGDPVQDNMVETPWARVGVLICSDTYHSLLPRQTALKGADLVLVPANWPDSGPPGLDPRELWSVRARENGIFLAACNRGGKDRLMSCETAPSAVFDPQGRPLAAHMGPASAIVTCDLPLDPATGRLAGICRDQAMAGRSPADYRPIYLDMRYVTYGGGDLTAYYEMPEPEPFEVFAYTAGTGQAGAGPPDKGPDPAVPGQKRAHQAMAHQAMPCQAMPHQEMRPETMLDTIQNHSPGNGYALMVFPLVAGGDTVISRARAAVQGKNLAVCFSLDQEGIFLVRDGQDLVNRPEKPCNALTGAPALGGMAIADAGPARIGICRPGELLCPEAGVAYAKLGCDLLVTSFNGFDQGTLGHAGPAAADHTVMAARSLDRACVAVAGSDMAFIAQPPQGHQRWKEARASRPGVCRARLDLTAVRDKRFQDRIDFKTLLS